MKKTNLIFLFSVLFLIFIGCEKQEVNVKKKYEAFMDSSITLEEKEETIQFLKEYGETIVYSGKEREFFVTIYLQGSKNEIHDKVKEIRKHKNIKKIDTTSNFITFDN